MNQAKEKLRGDFYAKTDISVNIEPENWQKYAEWLENLTVEKMNAEILYRYNRLYEKVEMIIDVLDKSLSER